MGKINGIVKDANEGSLDEVKVSLLNMADSSIAKVVVTDKSGAFKFENLGIGKYILLISDAGYKDYYSKPLEINTSQASVSINDIHLQSSGVILGQVTVVDKRP